MTAHPAYGFTRHGHAVHSKTLDHMPTDTAYQRLNKKLALLLTARVGTMSCFWVFCVISLSSLPAVLVAAKVIPADIGFIAAAGFILCVSWVSQNFIQLVLLPALMVGQNLQNEAADVRAAKTFEDVEVLLDRLDTKTQGGITEVLNAVADLTKRLDGLQQRAAQKNVP